MRGIAVVIPNSDIPNDPDLSGNRNFDNFSANFRPTVFDNSVKLAEKPPYFQLREGRIIPFAMIRACKVGVGGSNARLDIPDVRQVVTSGGRAVKIPQPES